MSSVISSTWSFVKRHKGKVILLGGVIGGFVYLKRSLGAVERNWEKSASKDFVAEVRKKETHFENSIRTCNSTCKTLAPKIIEILDKLLNCEAIVSQLKGTPGDVELWKELSIVIFTRAAAEVYSLCLFVCYLRVQLLVIAGYIYVDTCQRELSATIPSLATPPTSSTASQAISCNQNIQLKYLSLLNAFYDEGLKQLITPIREAVTSALEGISLKDKLSTNDLQSIFDQVRTKMLLYFKGPDGGTSRFLITPDKIDLSSVTPATVANSSVGSDSIDGTAGEGVHLRRKEREILKNLMVETQDLLETEDFVKVLNATIDVGFENLLDTLFTCFVNKTTKPSTPSPTDSGLSEEESSTNFLNPNTIKIPLAKLLPSLRNTLRNRSEEQLDQGESNLIRHLLCLDILNCYSANVYEAFCDPNNGRK